LEVEDRHHRQRKKLKATAPAIVNSKTWQWQRSIDQIGQKEHVMEPVLMKMAR